MGTNAAAAAAWLLVAITLPGTIELALLTLGCALERLGRARPAGRAEPPAGGAAPFRLAIVVPAHDEQERIGACVQSLLAARSPGVQAAIVVLADNCSDATARRAAEAGATVIERRDEAHPGKGAALSHAFERLRVADPDAVAVVDADSRVEPNLCAELAAAFRAGADAVQVRYRVLGEPASPRARLHALALTACNDLRPRGRAFWGLSAGILGNGFALSRVTLAAVPFRAGSVVEDLEYHLDLVGAGRRVALVAATSVAAELPVRAASAGSQRTRWEGGRMRMLRERAPGLVVQVLRGRLRLVEPLLDLLLLPLSYHVLLLAVAAVPRFPATRALAVAGLGVVALHGLLALTIARPRPRDLMALLALPGYALWKLALLPRIVMASRRAAAWTRTERDP